MENAGFQSDRDRRIQEVLDEARTFQSEGTHITDEDIIAKHLELMPELSIALKLRKKAQSYIDRATLFSTEDNRAFIPTINGYRVLKLIQRGGQGAVFLAIQLATGRKVAIKVLDCGPFIPPVKYDRFEREVRALAVIDHPGIVRIIDKGRTAERSFFIAMDFIDGEQLEVYLQRSLANQWTVQQVVELFWKIAGALAEAHRQGFVHRDIKPSNILIDQRGEPHILDFGLARLAVDDDGPAYTATRTGDVVGSVPWSSPEQVSGGSAKLDSSSDVYSLGVVLYTALAGHQPYELPKLLHEQVQRICETKPAALWRIKTAPFGRIDKNLSHIALRCLEKNPAQRYCDASALANDLHDFNQGAFSRPLKKIKPGQIATIAFCLAASGYLALLLTFGSNGISKPSPSVAKLSTMINSIGMTLIRIPEGAYVVGTVGQTNNEDFHAVTLTKPFFIGRTEVTRKQYLQVMGKLPLYILDPGLNPQFPVNYVSKYDAEEFCRKLGQFEHRRYFLPSDAQFEIACRAGNQGKVNGDSILNHVAWYTDNSSHQLHEVASKLPNDWGLFDTEGNVSEWCSDGYSDHLGSKHLVDPEFPSVSVRFGLVRGGSYLDGASECSAASRTPADPDKHLINVGFRVATNVATR
ncbi:MAG TPA: bifunctional serine/threonine-protein kinase/formylglycine-generating enzyme family protein [Tepidisphaeraceae bacterium]|jgi:serine/threonine protein kinase